MKIFCTKLQPPPEPLTRGLPPPDPRSLCPQLNLLNTPRPEKNSWVRHWITAMENTDKLFLAHHKDKNLHYSIYCCVLQSAVIHQYRKNLNGAFPIRIS